MTSTVPETATEIRPHVLEVAVVEGLKAPVNHSPPHRGAET